jgi:hypothetical protein
MSLESIAQELHGKLPEGRDPVRDTYELAKEFANTFYKEQGLLLLVGDSGVIKENTKPVNREDDNLPHDFVLGVLGYNGLNIYDGRISNFLKEVEREHSPGESIRDLAIGIDYKTGDVVGGRLFIKGSTGEDIETVPGGSSRHIAAADASKFDSIYSIAVSEERGKVTTFRGGKIIPAMCYDPAEEGVIPSYSIQRERTGLSPEVERALALSG